MKYLIIISFAFIAFYSTAQQKASYSLSRSFSIPSAGGWDYLSIGPDDKLYISHSTQVNIVDLKTGDSVGVIKGTTGVHGIAFNPAKNKGYTSNGRLNNIFVFNLSNQSVSATIPVGENPDYIFYENFSDKIITCNGKSHDLTIIDPTTEKVVATIPVGGKPETAMSDEKGKLFVNVEDKNEIVVIDLKEFKVLNHWSLLPGEAPTGLAIDLKKGKLYSTCGDSKTLVVMSTKDGKILQSLPIGAGCDGLVFDETKNLLFTSNGAGTSTIINTNAVGGSAEVIETLATLKSARTNAIDAITHKLYFPVADYDVPTTPNGRAPLKAGSFRVLEYSPVK